MKLILAFFILWALFGVVFYWSMIFKPIKKQPQKIVFFILCGPLYWIVAPIVLVLDLIAEKAFGPLYNWLTKE